MTPPAYETSRYGVKDFPAGDEVDVRKINDHLVTYEFVYQCSMPLPQLFEYIKKFLEDSNLTESYVDSMTTQCHSDSEDHFISYVTLATV